MNMGHALYCEVKLRQLEEKRLLSLNTLFLALSDVFDTSVSSELQSAKNFDQIFL